MDDPSLTADFATLYKVAFYWPAIDNHAHAFLKEEFRYSMPFEGLVSEAQGSALLEDAPHTLACYRATAQLAKLYKLPKDATWEDVKQYRIGLSYQELCRINMEPTKIQCILIDDGLGVVDMVHPYDWHDAFTTSSTKRLVRVEVVAQDILKPLVSSHLAMGMLAPLDVFSEFSVKFMAALTASAQDKEVVGFKSVACYRTGLDITITQTSQDIEQALTSIILRCEACSTSDLRLEHKALNDYIVCTTLRIAGDYGKPVQFHTGLGDNDISLFHSTPALMQPVIKAYPNTKFILLHSSYPFTQEAGYLTSVYRNVYLDFGEIFPFLSADGQRDVFKQVLELCPTNKILWSTDGHFWPESYYLGTLQAREVVYQVLESNIRRGEITIAQACHIVKRAFFYNSNEIYGLGLEPYLP
ncbi:amidohydrolase-domain-containing protein [Amylocystis lapponica]|nr:amidohydrolase-domain-containing protein [Amylocystis lapponica]